MEILDIITVIAVLLFSVIVHEVSHGYVAFRLGDPTAKDEGRITFNPLSHIDPFMSILLPAFLYFSHLPVVGGAKPVPVNPAYFKNRKKDLMLVSVAGPASNLALVIVGLVLFIVAVKTQLITNQGIQLFLTRLIEINTMLAVFNLIPVPPLDGSNILMGVLPDEMAYNYSKLAPYGIIIIIILLATKILNVLFLGVQFGLQKILNFIYYM